MAATSEKSLLRASQRTMDVLGRLIPSLFFVFRSWTSFNSLHFYSEFSGPLFQVFLPDLTYTHQALSRSRRRTLPYFALDSEGRISHHLWVFCALLALHVGWSHLNISSDAVVRLGFDTEHPFNEPKRNEDGTFRRSASAATPLESFHESYDSEVDAARFRGTPISEDVTILKRALFIQRNLEKTAADLRAESSFDDIEIWNRSSASGNVATSSERTDEKSRVSVTEGQSDFSLPRFSAPSGPVPLYYSIQIADMLYVFCALLRIVHHDTLGNFRKLFASVGLELQRDAEVLASPVAPFSGQNEEYSVGLQQRARRRSTISNQSDGSRQRVRVRRDQRTDVKICCEAGEAVEEAGESQVVSEVS